ncbi:hypothetical protein Y032_0021g282 [Ancylostoma ceylanicum]|uniref:Acireductone dioxygenase n=2 Tax=Ancylostoma ceylanicum TaxID=53326 RepID=A0A016UZK1_9BILA|nr:hypothetical protein Y032_0021g282 [Ancylostoma ceylanicum]
MASRAYFMGPVHDQRDDCRLVPNRDATSIDLADIGVEISSISMNPEWEDHLDNLVSVYDMNHRDEIHISRASMPDFDDKMKMFFEEHLHRDPEIRFIKSGTGFFDVRSISDEWIRIPVKRGDFVYLPAGIYHRFTTDWDENVVAIRLFRSSPKWEAFPRCKSGDTVTERATYLRSIGAADRVESS